MILSVYGGTIRSFLNSGVLSSRLGYPPERTLPEDAIPLLLSYSILCSFFLFFFFSIFVVLIN